MRKQEEPNLQGRTAWLVRCPHKAKIRGSNPLLAILVGLFLIFSLTLVSADMTHKQNTDLKFSITSNFADQCVLTTINTPTDILFVNQEATKTSQTFNFSVDKTNLTELGNYRLNIECSDTANKVTEYESVEVTPTGKKVEDVGQISVGLIYFFIMLGFGLILLGYLLLGNSSVFVSYGGLFLMLLGSAFLYYDLHLANLYASTIAYTSGAENVTSGAFVMVARFLKITPLIVAGVVAFSSVRLLKKALFDKKSSDGWDEDKY
jgi:hypothetical protein